MHDVQRPTRGFNCEVMPYVCALRQSRHMQYMETLRSRIIMRMRRSLQTIGGVTVRGGDEGFALSYLLASLAA